MRLKNKPKSLGQFIIDLTPLLDVIFIVLIVVLSFQDDYSKVADDRYTQATQIEQKAKDDISAASASLATAEEHIDTYANMHDYVNVVTIYASYKPSNRKYRTLHVEINNADLWEKEINPSNEDRIWTECQSYIEGKLADNRDLPTVFSIMDEKMLYRDEQSVLSLYENLNIKDKYEKNNMEKDDE
ncbi:MAG: hypothetical protein J5829_01990 [Lachnospiraceae bacterium]|nr:hypothetical protein [Lachnospiraceae bacterium]